MNPQTIHDAYAEWLAIDAAELPPHHYRLLGITLYESNPQAILAAHGMRTTQVATHLSGPQADVARQLLGELATAQACLLDPQAKAQYDLSLGGQQRPDPAVAMATANTATGFRRPAPRHETAPPTPPSNIPLAAAANSGAAAVAYGATAANARPPAEHVADPKQLGRQQHIEEPTSALPWLIGGVCAGLLGVCVLAMVLFGTRERPAVATAESDGPSPAATTLPTDNRDRDTTKRDRRLRSGTSTDQDPLGRRVAPTTAPDPLRWDRDPNIEKGSDLLAVDELDNPAIGVEATDDSSSESATDENTAPDEIATTTEKPTTRFTGVPRAIALPRRGEVSGQSTRGSSVLTRVEIDNPRDVQLQFVSNQLAGGSGRFEIVPDDGAPADAQTRTWAVQHSTDGSAAATVGQYTLAGGELSFEWAPDAPEASYAQLQNQPLQIQAGDESTTIAQRVPEQVAPIVVKVDAGAVGASVPIENPPENADVVVSIEDLGEAFGEHTWEPSSAINVGKSTMLRFGADTDAFQLAMKVTAEQTGPNKVRIEARPMFRIGDSKKWDFFRPTEAARTLSALQQQQSILDAQLQEIQRRYRRDPAARDQAAAMYNQQSAKVLENIATLQRISDRCQELQDKAELHFRVYAESGDAQIDLVRTSGGAVIDDRPLDENIGPPTDENIGPPADDKIGPPADASIGPPVDPVAQPPAPVE